MLPLLTNGDKPADPRCVQDPAGLLRHVAYRHAAPQTANALLRPQQQGLPGRHALPAADLRQAVQSGVVEHIEQRDATQGEAGAWRYRHGQAARIMLGAA